MATRDVATGVGTQLRGESTSTQECVHKGGLQPYSFLFLLKKCHNECLVASFPGTLEGDSE